MIELNKYYKVKKEGYYPLHYDIPTIWPNRQTTIYLSENDVLTGQKERYTKHTGVMRTNIVLKDNEVELVDKYVYLGLI